MDVRSLLLVLAVLAVIAAIVFSITWSERKSRMDRDRIAKALGFQPIEELDRELSSRLMDLHRHTPMQELKVQNVSEQIDGSTRILLFDMIDHGGDSVSTLVSAGIAIFSTRLHLPRFSLIPRVAEKGRIAGFANNFLEMLIEKRSNRIQLGANVHFDERYFLLGDEEASIRVFLDTYRLSRLSQSTYRHLEADGDCFTYSRFVFASRTKRNLRVDLKRDIFEARALLELFSD